MTRLRMLREASGYKQKEFATLIGVPANTYNQWETGKRAIDSTMLVRISRALQTSVDNLLGEETVAPRTRATRIPVYGDVAAGIPIEAIVNYDSDDPDDWEEIPDTMASNGAHIALRIKGDSMEPRMRTGDVVIVRLQDTIESDELAVVRVNGDEATCKRVKITAEGLFLISLNPAYEPMFYSRQEVESVPVRILGKVVELRAKF